VQEVVASDRVSTSDIDRLTIWENAARGMRGINADRAGMPSQISRAPPQLLVALYWGRRQREPRR
jgi:hypothetical protein